jgi:Tfp pilus assembly protein PilE
MHCCPDTRPVRQHGGATLLGVLLSLVLSVALALFAVPAWQAHRLRLHRVDARTELLSTAQRLAACFERLQAYDNPACTVSLPAAVADNTYQLQGTVEHGAYHLIAHPLGEQEADGECGDFQLDHQGQRSVSGTLASKDCW